MRFAGVKLTILFCLLFCVGARGQEHLVAVLEERTMAFDEQLDSILVEFGDYVNIDNYKNAIKVARKLGRPARFVAIEYRTVDPKGNPVVASGLIAYPEKGRFRGTVEVTPYAREKTHCGSRRVFSTECIPTNFGYVTLIPDTIGFGSSEDLPIAYLMYENSARVSADLRLAAKEYFAMTGGDRTLPDKTVFYGYSLGAPGALATAGYYHSHPEIGVKIKRVCIGSGPYSPVLALKNTVYKGEITYLIYPGIAKSVNSWLDLGLDYAKLFRGPVRDDFDIITDGSTNLRVLAEKYGFKVQQYLCPDFFLPEKNEEIEKLMEGLAALEIPGEGFSLPRNVRIDMLHGVEDMFVPVDCSDILYQKLKKDYPCTRYMRIPKVSHYETAAISLVDLVFTVLL
jgi:pimeloyl-ACP methyl ester carboxylesterase